MVDPVRCPDCDRVYVKTHKIIDERIGVSYLDDFPKYGLDKEQCKECEDSNARIE